MATEAAQQIRNYHYDHYRSDGFWSVKFFCGRRWLITHEGFETEKDAVEFGEALISTAKVVDINLMGVMS